MSLMPQSLPKPKHKRPTGPRKPRAPVNYTTTDKQKMLDEVARLERLGYSQTQIGEIVGVGQPTVCRYVKEVRQRYLDSQLDTRHAYVVRELAVLMDVRREAAMALEESKLPAEKKVIREREPKPCPSCRRPVPGGGRKEPRKKCRLCKGSGFWVPPPDVTDTITGRLAHAEYMRVIVETSKAVRELLGLDEAVKVDVSGTVGVVNLVDLLAQAAQARGYVTPGSPPPVLSPKAIAGGGDDEAVDGTGGRDHPMRDRGVLDRDHGGES